MHEQRLYDALKRIAAYDSPDKLRQNSQKRYGIDAEEAIEGAYENVLQEAKDAIRGMRRPSLMPSTIGKSPTRSE